MHYSTSQPSIFLPRCTTIRQPYPFALRVFIRAYSEDIFPFRLIKLYFLWSYEIGLSSECTFVAKIRKYMYRKEQFLLFKSWGMQAGWDNMVPVDSHQFNLGTDITSQGSLWKMCDPLQINCRPDLKWPATISIWPAVLSLLVISQVSGHISFKVDFCHWLAVKSSPVFVLDMCPPGVNYTTKQCRVTTMTALIALCPGHRPFGYHIIPIDLAVPCGD